MRSTASPPPTYRSNVGSLLRIPLTSRYNTSNGNGATSGGSSTSIFGGISGIISGAMGSSSNSINGIATQSHPAGPVDSSTPTTSLLSDPAGAPPPTYRTIDRRNSSTSIEAGTTTATGDYQVQVQKPPPEPTSTTTPTGDSIGTTTVATVEGGVSLINDDNTLPTRKTGTGTGSAPSIIKIDDGKSTAATAVGSSPMTSDQAPPHKQQRNSITSEIIENDSKRTRENVANKDLVTIVTISGTLEQKQPNLNKSQPPPDAPDSKKGAKSKSSKHDAAGAASPGKL